MTRIVIVAALFFAGYIAGVGVATRHQPKIKLHAHADPECTVTAAPPIEGGEYISIRCSKGTMVTMSNDPTDGYVQWHLKTPSEPTGE